MFIKVYGFYLHTTLSLKQKTKRLGVWGAGFVLLLFFFTRKSALYVVSKNKQTNKQKTGVVFHRGQGVGLWCGDEVHGIYEASFDADNTS